MKPISSISAAGWLFVAMLAGQPLCGMAQRVLSLDSCRALALAGNKPLAISHTNRQMAEHVRSAARTDYLPKLDAVGTYQLSSREVSLLNDRQKSSLNHLGTNLATQLPAEVASLLPAGAAEALNAAGSSVRQDLRTNTRNLFGADVLVRQPLYAGGAIKAANKAADINVGMADDNIDLATQNTLYDVDRAYWQVVSLRQKQLLAEQYLALVRQLHSDVAAMLGQGVATQSDELRVAVRVNEAEMQQTQVDDGLELSRMNLCRICGIDLNAPIRLADEETAEWPAATTDAAASANLDLSRPELRLLSKAVDLSKENVRLAQAAFLPQLFATGGYFMSNPNVLNSYRNTFSGLFHVGVTLRVPLWNWGEGRHRVRAARTATTMAQLELSEMREKIDLQVQQARFRVREADKKLGMATRNLTSANENLRCANLGFKEGMMQTTDVMEAQTAWQSAQSQKIDAEIEVRMAQINLERALGTLAN